MRALILAAVLLATSTAPALANQPHGPGATPVRQHICLPHPPGGPPPHNATALCVDGTYTTNPTASACSAHCGRVRWIKHSNMVR
jgi:hypothetical protein